MLLGGKRTVSLLGFSPLPGMGGRELVERLTPQRPELRVLYISGYTSDEVVRKGGGGTGRFVQKPFTSEVLLRSVRERLAEPPGPAAPAASNRSA